MAGFEQFEGFGGTSGIGQRPGIVVVDFIQGFTDATCPLGSNLDEEVKATRVLLDTARKREIPVAFTTVIYEPHFRDGGHFIEKIPALKALVATSDWVKVDPRLGRTENEPLIIKKFASAFFGTALQSFFTSQQVDTVIVTGCTTSGCVRATAVDALQYGYRVVVPRECVGDRSQSAHEANLYDIQTKYGDVISLESLLKVLEA